jgi:hypothetical protein
MASMRKAEKPKRSTMSHVPINLLQRIWSQRPGAHNDVHHMMPRAYDAAYDLRSKQENTPVPCDFAPQFRSLFARFLQFSDKLLYCFAKLACAQHYWVIGHGNISGIDALSGRSHGRFGKWADTGAEEAFCTRARFSN